MKKAIFLIAAALLFCSEMKAQDMDLAFNYTPTIQYSLLDDSQSQLNSIYELPMPTSDLAVSSQLANQQYASRKGWGIACIVAGGTTLIGGASIWLFGGIFSNISSEMNNMGFEDDPDFQQGQDIAEGAGNVIKTVGIVGTVVGAALVGTGIWLVSSDSGSSHRRGGHGRRGGHRRHRRYSESLPGFDSMQPDWALSLNVGPTSTGLTLSF